MRILLFTLTLFWCLNSFAQNPFEGKKGKINKTPLSISQVLFELSGDHNDKAFITLHLKLAQNHKAYANVFKVNSPIKSFKASTPEISPLTPYIDKFSNGKEKMVVIDQAVARFFLSSATTKLSGEQTFSLTYQACTEDYCLLPQDLDFKINFPLVEKKESSSQGFSFEKLFSNIDSMPIWLVLLATYFFGLLTAFTPCVLPMIPITMGILGFSSTSSRAKGFAIGLSYALGLSLTYAVVGVGVALTGGFLGQALTNPYVVWGVFIFYVFTALAMAGVFTIKAPTVLEKQFSKVENKGALGAFLAGAVAGVVASPCVGPAVAAVLAYVAQTGKPSFGFVTLFVFGMGLGTLFILIGTFYGEINSRIKPGKWLNWVKYALSFLILVGAFLFIKPHLSFLNKSHSHANLKSKKLWTPFSKEKYDNALSKKKLIIIDFRADWCAACHELEQHTFSTSGFKQDTKDIALLKFDATKPNAEEQKLLSKFDVFGLPTILFIDTNGKVRDDLTLTGFEPWQDFKKRIQALKK